jgi:hypothetical protein
LTGGPRKIPGILSANRFCAQNKIAMMFIAHPVTRRDISNRTRVKTVPITISAWLGGPAEE